LSYYLYLNKYPLVIVIGVFIIYMTIEFGFLIANLSKLNHGGWVTILLGFLLSSMMYVLYQSRKIRNRLVEFIDLKDYLPLLDALSKDTSIPKYATHLVYLTSANNTTQIEEKVMYSILQKLPKRADMYWFVHVDVIDEPYLQEYKVTELEKENVFRVDFRIGFRIDPRVNLMFRQVVEELVKNKEVDITSRYSSLKKRNMTGDFRFVVMEKFLSLDNDLPAVDKIIMDVYFFVKKFSLPEEKAFGLDTSSVTVEKVPLIVKPISGLKLKRLKE
jgi:KUP system potassium uptake protein